MNLRADVEARLVEVGQEKDVAARLADYARLLDRWGRVHNLVKFASAAELVDRHLLDSLAAVANMEEARGLLVDVGSGGGLPGVPLLVAKPGWRGLLLEPRTKRWAFLREVIRELGLDAEVQACRFQDAKITVPPDVIAARAVGQHDVLLTWAASRLAPAGRVLLWVGRDEGKRLGTLSDWHVVSSPLPTLERGVLVCLRPCFT